MFLLMIDSLYLSRVGIPEPNHRVKYCLRLARSAGGKDDAVDTFVLAEVVRLSGDRFRPLLVILCARS